MKETTDIAEHTPQRKKVLEEMDATNSRYYLYSNNSMSTCDTLQDLCLDWLESRYCTVKRSTYAGYCYGIKMHVLPFFGNINLAELNGDIVHSFIDKMQEKGLADTTVRSTLITFKAVLKLGIQLKLLNRDILSYCSVNGHKSQSKVLTMQDSMEMKAYLLEQNTIFSVAILLCRGTGMRIGELCGLKWGDINFSTNSIIIKRTISRIPNPDPSSGQPKTILYIRTPKSHTSVREIPIPQYLVRPLREMKKGKNDYVLTGKDTCTEPRNIQKKFKTILKRCDMQNYNFHAMRHGFATACLEKGIDCKTVSSILGHASTRTTMDFYVHTSLQQKQNCIDVIA